MNEAAPDTATTARKSTVAAPRTTGLETLDAMGETVTHHVGALQEDLALGTKGAVDGARGAFLGVVQEVDALGNDFEADRKQMAGESGDDQDKKDEEDLFILAGSALFSSTLVYLLADLRMMMSKNRDDFQGDEELIRQFIDLPIKDIDALKVLEANDELVMTALKENGYNLYISAIEKYAQEVKLQLKQQQQQQSRKQTSIRQSIMTKVPRELVVFDDSNSQKELVYSIVVDR